jgi:isopentenyl phosphate kinase
MRTKIKCRKYATWCARKVPPADGTVDVIVKLGGAAITVKDGEPDTPNLGALKICCEKIADAVNTHGYTLSPRTYDVQYLKMIIVHGAGSFGHPQAKEYGVANGGDVDGNARLKEGIEKTKTSVRKLRELVCDELSKENGYHPSGGSIAPDRVAPISPYGKFFTVGKKLNRNLSRGGIDEVRAAVMAGKVPVLHGDVVCDSEQGCAILSGDTLVECLTEEFKPKRVVFISDVEGIFTSKPLHKDGPCDICPDGRTPPPALLREIQVKPDGSWVATKAAGPLQYISAMVDWTDPEWVDANPEWVFNEALDKLVVKAAVGTTDATVSLEDNGDVTGGIKTKVQEAAAIALKGVDVFLTHVHEMNRYGDAILKGDADDDDDYMLTHVLMAPGAAEVKTEVKVEPP